MKYTVSFLFFSPQIPQPNFAPHVINRNILFRSASSDTSIANPSIGRPNFRSRYRFTARNVRLFASEMTAVATDIAKQIQWPSRNCGRPSVAGRVGAVDAGDGDALVFC